MQSFFAELKRRNVFKVGVAYTIVAWLLIQVIVSIEAPLHLPNWSDTLIIILLAIGFPVALILAWAYEMTPEGVRKTQAATPEENIPGHSNQKLNYFIIGMMALAIAFLVIDNYVLVDRTSEEIGVRSEEDTIETTLSATEDPAVSLTDRLANSIAVLPFENLSPREEDAYFAVGLHEEVLNQLAGLSNMNVIAGTTMRHYANTEKSMEAIAKELNVETVMEGNVRYADGRVRVTTQLIDGREGVNLWSDTYERDFKDIFSIESDIAMNVANAMLVAFSLEEQEEIEKIPTESTQAYALYLKAIENIRQFGSTDRTIDFLSRAIEIDPEFAEAYGQRGNIETTLLVNAPNWNAVSRSNRINLLQRARQDTETALRLNPDSGLPHSTRGVLLAYRWRFTESREDFERALELNPNDPEVLAGYGFFGVLVGDPDEAIQIGRRALDLDPGNPLIHYEHALALRFAKRPDEAVAASRQAAKIKPDDMGIAFAVSSAEVQSGKFREAEQSLRLTEELFHSGNYNGVMLAWFAEAYKQIGLQDRAMELFTEFSDWAIDQPVGEGTWAMAYIAINDYETALVRLNRAIEKISKGEADEGFWFLVHIYKNIYSDPVLEQPEFLEARRKLGSMYE